MKRVVLLGVLLAFFACSESKKQGNMVVTGQIKGLKKATLYLQKMKDTVMVSVDSIALLGDDHFTLSDNLDSPQMYRLYFDAKTEKKEILFFGEEGQITIEDDLNRLGVNTKVEGSENQKRFNEYKKMTTKFQNKQLDLVKENFDAQKRNDAKTSDSLRLLSEKTLKRRYLFSANFALRNSDYEVAPYIALTDLVDANIKILDTIHTSLSEKVKKSFYGKKLDKFISDIKKSEN